MTYYKLQAGTTLVGIHITGHKQIKRTVWSDVGIMKYYSLRTAERQLRGYLEMGTVTEGIDKARIVKVKEKVIKTRQVK